MTTEKTSELHESAIEKNLAEARAADALARRHDVEAQRSEAERIAILEEATKNRLQAASYQITLDREIRKENTELAKDKYSHVYQFQGGVTAAAVEVCIEVLSEWSRTAPECPIEIVFDSPGGSVFAGFRLYDFIQDLRRRKHHITTVAMGMAASMGSILLQAGDERVVTANSFVMIHEISTGASGKIGDIEDTMELVKKMSERGNAILAGRSKLTVAKVKNMQTRKDVWLSAEDCLAHGFVDAIR